MIIPITPAREAQNTSRRNPSPGRLEKPAPLLFFPPLGCLEVLAFLPECFMDTLRKVLVDKQMVDLSNVSSMKVKIRTLP